MFTIEPIPAFSDNYIWLLVQGTKAFAVDPGDAKPLISILKKRKLELTGVLITHHHYDHSGGILEILDKYDAKIYGPTGNHINGITDGLVDNQSIDVLGVSFKALSVPGHTDDQLAYFCNSSTKPILFSGDTLFAAGCGRLFEGSPRQMHASLSRFAELPPETLVYCGHEYTLSNLNFASKVEPTNEDISSKLKKIKKLRSENKVSLPSSISEELKTNPFMRCDKKNVINAAEKFAAKTLNSPSEVLGVIRKWKDNF